MLRQRSSREYESTKPEYSPLSKGRQGSPLRRGRRNPHRVKVDSDQRNPPEGDI